MDDATLLEALRARFVEHGWHDERLWPVAEAKLRQLGLEPLRWMEETGGEPAVAPWWIGDEPVVVCDCSPESPQGRRSLCYDRAAWEARKKARPEGDACSLAEAHGVRLMTESEYLHLQAYGQFDTKTSSWLHTADAVRDQGGAIFGDRRFGRVFIYCNGAESYYGVRGFRTVLSASEGNA